MANFLEKLCHIIHNITERYKMDHIIKLLIISLISQSAGLYSLLSGMKEKKEPSKIKFGILGISTGLALQLLIVIVQLLFASYVKNL